MNDDSEQKRHNENFQDRNLCEVGNQKSRRNDDRHVNDRNIKYSVRMNSFIWFAKKILPFREKTSSAVHGEERRISACLKFYVAYILSKESK